MAAMRCSTCAGRGWLNRWPGPTKEACHFCGGSGVASKLSAPPASPSKGKRDEKGGRD